MRLLTLVLASVLLASAPARAEVRSYLERQRFQAPIERLTVEGRFGELEQQAEDLRKRRARSATGVWLQSQFHAALAEGFKKSITDQASWTAVDTALADLVKQRPASKSAAILHAIAIQQNAWRLRGPGFYQDTTPAQRLAFRQGILRAQALLDHRKESLADNPEWFVQRIALATFGGEGGALVEQLFAEGVQREPLYYQLHFAALYHHLPRWGGSVDQMVAFMNRVMTLPATAEGRSMYARMAWFAEQVGAPEVMDHPGIDWTLMKQSFDDVLRAHPDDWNAQQFLLMACSRPDLAAVKRMAAFVKEAPSEALLRRNLPMFQQCLDLAQGKGGPLLVMDPATGRLREVR